MDSRLTSSGRLPWPSTFRPLSSFYGPNTTKPPFTDGETKSQSTKDEVYPGFKPNLPDDPKFSLLTLKHIALLLFLKVRNQNRRKKNNVSADIKVGCKLYLFMPCLVFLVYGWWAFTERLKCSYLVLRWVFFSINKLLV